MKRKTVLTVLATMFVAVLCIFGPQSAGATLYTLTDGNSSADFNDSSSTGMYNWSIDGADVMFQQSFWYRVGDTGGESNISNLAVSSTTTGTNQLKSTYTDTGLKIEVTYTLIGGDAGSGTSDIQETIKISNTSGGAISFHFFQYNDFDLGDIGGDTAAYVNANTIDQSDPNYAFSEVVGTPAPSHYQLGGFPSIRNLLDDANPTTLADGPTTFGPGDATWAWQWDFTINAGSSKSIGKAKHIEPLTPVSVPEPGTMMLLGSSLVVLAVWGRKKFRK